MVLKIDKIIRSNRKTLALEVNNKSLIIVKAPQNICESVIHNFVMNNYDWIIRRKDENLKKYKKLNLINYQYHNRPEYKKSARKILNVKAQHYSRLMNIKYNKIKISDAKKRWGSCSAKKTINLNWRLIFAPNDVIDYVVVHELSHLIHLNHSDKFWNEVQKYIHDHKKSRKWLRENDFLMLID